ncbi:MAG: ACT domain-containing protein [Desulfobacterales bacterium]|nr:ACT domain-containing protein [Desulfobacterales bacterium]
MEKIIITVVGPDRPRIVATVSKALFAKECNIENVSHTTLQTEFAGIFIASIPENFNLQDIHKSLKDKLIPLGLDVHVKLVNPPEFSQVTGEPFVITTRGPDRKGLVASITGIIADYGINIARFRAVFKGGSEPDKNIMIYEIDVPNGVDQNKFCSDLKEKANELGLEANVQHRKIFEVINRI